MREVDYRVDVLRGNVRYTSLKWDASEPPTVYSSKKAAIKSSLSGSFLKDDSVDYISDEIQPVIIINGTETPLGVFRAATWGATITEYGASHKIEAYDRCWRVQSRKAANILHLDAGTNYLTAITGLLLEAGISLYMSDPTTETLQTDREDWKAGTDYLTIANQLLGEINYNPLWFDNRGMARLEKQTQPGAGNIKWKYGAGDVNLPPMSDECSEETDVFSKANVFVVICSNPDMDAPMVAKSINDSPISSTSVFRRGMEITSVTQVKNIASQSELQEYADNLKYQSMRSDKTVTFSTFAEPGHGVGDVLALTHPEIEGIYEEIGWEIKLAPGELMKHTAKRTVMV